MGSAHHTEQQDEGGDERKERDHATSPTSTLGTNWKCSARRAPQRFKPSPDTGRRASCQTGSASSGNSFPFSYNSLQCLSFAVFFTSQERAAAPARHVRVGKGSVSACVASGREVGARAAHGGCPHFEPRHIPKCAHFLPSLPSTLPTPAARGGCFSLSPTYCPLLSPSFTSSQPIGTQARSFSLSPRVTPLGSVSVAERWRNGA